MGRKPVSPRRSSWQRLLAGALVLIVVAAALAGCRTGERESSQAAAPRAPEGLKAAQGAKAERYTSIRLDNGVLIQGSGMSRTEDGPATGPGGGDHGATPPSAELAADQVTGETRGSNTVTTLDGHASARVPSWGLVAQGERIRVDSLDGTLQYLSIAGDGVIRLDSGALIRGRDMSIARKVPTPGPDSGDQQGGQKTGHGGDNRAVAPSDPR